MTDTSAIPLPAPPGPSAARRTLGAARTRLSRLARRASTLLPHTLCFSAIFQKEMRVSGRKNSTFITRGIYGVLLVGLALLVFLAARAGSDTQTGAAAIQQLQDVAPAVTTAILWFQMILLPLVACMITGPSICDEVRNRSLPALLTTPLNAAQIVFSKLSGALVHIAILALLSLPLLLGLRLFGGIDATIVLGGAALTLTTAILAGSVGMLVSVFAKRSALAGTGAIASTLGILALPVPIIFLLMARGLIPQTAATELVGVVSGPVSLGMVLVMAAGDPGPPGLTIPGILTGNITYNLVASLILLALASIAFRGRLTGDRGEASLGVADKQRLHFRKPKRRRTDVPSSIADGPPDASSPPGTPTHPTAPLPGPAQPEPTWPEPHSRAVGDRPVLWRELRRQGTRSASRRVGLAGAIFTMAMLAVLGVFLPLYGMGDAMLNTTRLRSPGASSQTIPLQVATVAFSLFAAGVAILTAFRAVKRIGLGSAVVVPPRTVLVLTLVFGVLLFIYWAVDGEFEGLHTTIAALGPGLVFLRAATQNAGTLAEEREARTWETLLTTRLSPREILLGKLAGSLARQWDIPAVVLLHFAFAGVVLTDLPPIFLLHIAITMIAGIAFLSGTGMLCALLVSKGSIASLLNAGIALGLWLILPIAAGFSADALGVSHEINQALGTVVLGGQPLALGIFALHGAINYGSYGDREYEIVDATLSPGAFTLVLVGVSALYVLAGLGALGIATSLFNRKTGRTS